MRLRISTVLLSATLFIGVAFAQSSQAITGTVTDAMCGAHHVTCSWVTAERSEGLPSLCGISG
jgi:hypothetical protein